MRPKLIKIFLVSLVTILVIIPFSSVRAYFSDDETAPFTFSTGLFSTGSLNSKANPVYFENTETNTDRDFTAGTVNIAVNDQDPWSETYEFTNMTPGRWSIVDIDIMNIGNNDITYKITAQWNEGSKPLFDALKVEIWDKENNILISNPDQFLKDLDTSPRFLGHGKEEKLRFKVKLRDDADNSYQNLTTKFNLHITATQTKDRGIVLYVPDEYPTIQAAVDAADPGDIIIVRDETYTENINVNKDYLTIRSENGPEKTIVQAANIGDSVFKILADFVTINGFTIKGGNYGILFDVIVTIYGEHRIADHSTISNNIITKNSTGIYSYGTCRNPKGWFCIMDYSTSNLVVKNDIVANNNGGIPFTAHEGSRLGPNKGKSNNVIENNNILDNSGPGIELQGAYNKLLNNNISNNNSGVYLYGWSTGGGNIITGNTISNNRGYGLRFAYSGGNEVYHNNFIGNLEQVKSYNSRNYFYKEYPEGGNYWSDYMGTDEKSGPDQDQPGSDGIGDTPYTFTSRDCHLMGCYTTVHEDKYPFMRKNGWEAPEKQPPSCVIELRKNGNEINEINVGEAFDIVFTNYSGDIKKVRFLSDESQNGEVDEGFTWTDWYDWEISSDGWNHESKIMNWSFTTGGEKEVWAEVEDNRGRTARCYAGIFAVEKQPPAPPDYFSEDWIEKVINWAFKQEGKDYWTECCMAFVSDAFKVCENRPGFANELKSAFEKEDKFYSKENNWDPPKGCLVFFSATGEYAPYGHIGISLSNRRVIHALGKVKIQSITDIENDDFIDSYLGWAYPPEDWFSPKFSNTFKKGDIISKKERWNLRDIPSLYGECDSTVTNLSSNGEIIEDKYNGICNAGHYWWHIKINVNGKQKEGWCIEEGLEKVELEPLPKIIHEKKIKDIKVIVEGREYHIVTISCYINPETLKCLSDSGPTKVYTDSRWEPVFLPWIAEKIAYIDYVYQLQKEDILQKKRLLEKIDEFPYKIREIAEYIESKGWTEAGVSIGVLSISLPSTIKTALLKLIKKVGEKTAENLLFNGMDLLIEEIKNDFIKTQGEYIKLYQILKNNGFKNIIDDKSDDLQYNKAIELFETYSSAKEKEGMTNFLWDKIYNLEIGSDTFERIGIALWNTLTVHGSEHVLASVLKEQLLNMASEGKFTVILPRESMFYTLKLAGFWGVDYDSAIWVKFCSPGELRVYDSQNRVTGLVSGEVKEEIPNSIYDAENKAVIIFDPFDTYRYEVVGIEDPEEDTYGLTVTSVEDGEVTTFTATDIPITPGEVHQYTIDWDVLSQGGEGTTLKIDLDGDGNFDKTHTTGNTLDMGGPKLETQIAITEMIYGEVDILDEVTKDVGDGVAPLLLSELKESAVDLEDYTPDGKINPGKKKKLKMKFKFLETAGNEYQGKSINVKFKFKATQEEQ
ncbi:MAG: hypothetical protein DRI01_04480 [Chloroflexi bacterium]|nr:MAG: hypothetical protein DRI01_04480 [Chloroflexota bacterium]